MGVCSRVDWAFTGFQGCIHFNAYVHPVRIQISETGSPKPPINPAHVQAGEFAARSPRIATFAAAEALKGVVTVHRQQWLA